jgi:hypothetical protein
MLEWKTRKTNRPFRDLGSLLITSTENRWHWIENPVQMPLTAEAPLGPLYWEAATAILNEKKSSFQPLPTRRNDIK